MLLTFKVLQNLPEKLTHQCPIALLYFLFVLMILMQNFMLINNHTNMGLKINSKEVIDL